MKKKGVSSDMWGKKEVLLLGMAHTYKMCKAVQNFVRISDVGTQAFLAYMFVCLHMKIVV